MLSDREKEFIKLSTRELRKSSGINTFQATELEQFNHLDLKHYKHWTEQASSYDFQWLVDMESPTLNEREGVRTAIRVLIDANREHSCAIWHYKPKWYMRLLSVLFRMGPLKVVECETFFNDDSCVVTTTAKEQGEIYHPPEIVTHAVKVRSFAELYELHRMHVSEHLNEQAARAIRPINSLEDVFSMQQVMDQQKSRHMQNHHYLPMEQLPKSIQNDPDKRAAAMAYAKQLNADQDPVIQPAERTGSEVSKSVSDASVNHESAVHSAISQLELADSALIKVAIDHHPEAAWVVGSAHHRVMQDWQKLNRSLRGQYVPVITQLFIQGDDLAEQVAELELLSRYRYEAEMEMDADCGFTTADPQAVLQASERIDHQQAVKKLLREQLIFDQEELAEEVEYTVDGLQEAFGDAPDVEACLTMVRDGRIKHSAAWAGWLLNWVIKQHREAARAFSQTDLTADFRVTSADKYPGLDDTDVAIVLLPVKQAWQVPALIDSEVVEAMGSAAFCALARHWQDQYQATIIGIDNCTIEWHVGKPPKTLKEALQLAILHNALAPSTLAQPGIDVWQYALSLLGRKRWCLWESPG
jgi:hypothetical protein